VSRESKALVILTAGLFSPHFAAAGAAKDANALSYPVTRKDAQIDDYHGTRVADPAGWKTTTRRKSPQG
jgi:hypothetical protein